MSLLEVKIPPLGESISSGVLAKWHVKNGDTVKKDQPLFELETDKITSEGVAEAAGVITLKAGTGAEVKIGEVVASIDTAAAAPVAAPAPISPSVAAASALLTSDVRPSTSSTATESPAVRRLAADTGIDPATVAGTGKAGRVTKGDMLAAATTPKEIAAAIAAAPAAAVPATAPVVSTPPAGKKSRVKMTKLRQTIAKRLVAAQHEAAMLTTFN
jgi:2-oxoglutarate dehydrogenase E2 component (dihydrolipoamide succinyltransferase)